MENKPEKNSNLQTPSIFILDGKHSIIL